MCLIFGAFFCNSLIKSGSRRFDYFLNIGLT
nr:MAG TPA: hypothetical protein [Caudoviricetes sp.]